MARYQFIVSKFIRTVLKYCKNKPMFVVDKGVWYKNFKEWALITKMKPSEEEM